MLTNISLLYIFAFWQRICIVEETLNLNFCDETKIVIFYAAYEIISILIFFRQLEAIIRMSESLAKMSLSPFATEVHVDEALRLFQVSTLEAAMSGNLSGMTLQL